MKYKIPTLLFLSLVILLAYQNCSNSLNTNSNAESVSTLDVKMGELKQIRYWTFDDQRNPTEWTINPLKAQLTLRNSDSESRTVFCFFEEDFSSLQQLLDTATLCQKSISSSGEICTQKYSSPSAILDFQNSSISIGEEKDGCGTGRIDFCDQKTALFLSEVEKIISKRFSVNCL